MRSPSPLPSQLWKLHQHYLPVVPVGHFIKSLILLLLNAALPSSVSQSGETDAVSSTPVRYELLIFVVGSRQCHSLGGLHGDLCNPCNRDLNRLPRYYRQMHSLLHSQSYVRLGGGYAPLSVKLLRSARGLPLLPGDVLCGLRRSCQWLSVDKLYLLSISNSAFRQFRRPCDEFVM